MAKKTKPTKPLSAEEEQQILTAIARDTEALAITRVRSIQLLREIEAERPAEQDEDDDDTLASLAELRPQRGQRKGSSR